MSPVPMRAGRETNTGAGRCSGWGLVLACVAASKAPLTLAGELWQALLNGEGLKFSQCPITAARPQRLFTAFPCFHGPLEQAVPVPSGV